MSKEISVILAKTSWCPHCTSFSPIYELAAEKMKNHDDMKVKYSSYELDKSNNKQLFMSEHPGLFDHVDGYPTVFIETLDDNKKRVITTVPHSVAKTQRKEDMHIATDEFINNIKNSYKSLMSEHKEYRSVQSGGSNLNNKTTLNQEIYRNKYIKYKQKYINLKNLYDSS